MLFFSTYLLVGDGPALGLEAVHLHFPGRLFVIPIGPDQIDVGKLRCGNTIIVQLTIRNAHRTWARPPGRQVQV